MGWLDLQAVLTKGQYIEQDYDWESTISDAIQETWVLAEILLNVYLSFIYWLFNTSKGALYIVQYLAQSDLSALLLAIGLPLIVITLFFRSTDSVLFKILIFFVARVGPIIGACICIYILTYYFQTFHSSAEFITYVTSNLDDEIVVFNALILPYLSFVWLAYGLIALFMGHQIAGTTVGNAITATLFLPLALLVKYPLYLIYKQLCKVSV